MIEFSNKDLEDLKKYCFLCNTEYGEVCRLLCSILTSYEPFLSEDFFEEVKKEASDMLKNFKENCKIVEIEETYKQKFKKLVWE